MNIQDLEKKILNHPYYVEKEENRSVWKYKFIKKEEAYYLFINKRFDPEEETPVDYLVIEDHTLNRIPCLWFVQFMIEISNDYFHLNRLRFKIANKRRPLDNILWLFSLKSKTNKNLYEKMLDQEERKIFCISIYYKPTIHELLAMIEKDGYQFIVHQKNSKNIEFSIS
jgi:hypothetical protein